MNWGWLDRNLDTVLEDLQEHVEIALIALVLGVLIAFPIGLIAYRWRVAYGPLLAITQILYTVPSLALFVILPGILGTRILDEANVVVALSLYTAALLVRPVADALTTLPPHVLAAATAVGYKPLRRFLTVELPLAVPVLGAGVRVASVSNISLVSVGAIIGIGGLGQLFTEGFTGVPNLAPIVLGILLILALALVVDLVLVGAQRLLTPWQPRRRRTRSTPAEEPALDPVTMGSAA